MTNSQNPKPPPDGLYWKLKHWLKLRYRLKLARRLTGRAAEILRYSSVRPEQSVHFHIVSSERNAGDAAVKCLDSVYSQNYDRARVRHLYIDDASTDETDRLVRDWLTRHPDHSVEYIHNDQRIGGSKNNLDGIRKAEPGCVVIELNGDDWLPDPRTLLFLNKVYANRDVWMTYNTVKVTDGTILKPLGYPRALVRENRFREHAWLAAHLHTFRREFFDHIKEESLIDPKTGSYWESSDDKALYLPMLELAGSHARHIYRIMCVYNFRDLSEHNLDRAGQIDRGERIHLLPRYQPLAELNSAGAKRP